MTRDEPPPGRRGSLAIALAVLLVTGAVIYAVFPARHNVLVTSALALHGEAVWEVTAPTPPQLAAWLTRVLGEPIALPAGDVVGARQLEILHRAAALMRVRLGGDELTLLVQHARGIAPERSERVEGALRAVAWRAGPFTVVAVGADASAARWRAAIGQ